MPAFHVAPFEPSDHERWLELWLGYLDFYGATLDPAVHEATWARITAEYSPIRGLGLRIGAPDAELVGLAHVVFHESTWAIGNICYLSDLYVDKAARGQGAARHLIEVLADQARGLGCSRLYWLTHESNKTARTLYDQVAAHLGFLEYEYKL